MGGYNPGYAAQIARPSACIVLVLRCIRRHMSIFPWLSFYTFSFQVGVASLAKPRKFLYVTGRASASGFPHESRELSHGGE